MVTYGGTRARATCEFKAAGLCLLVAYFCFKFVNGCFTEVAVDLFGGSLEFRSGGFGQQKLCTR